MRADRFVIENLALLIVPDHCKTRGRGADWVQVKMAPLDWRADSSRRERAGVMKGIGGKYLAPAAMAALLGAAALAQAEPTKSSGFSHKALEDKLFYCKTCHGVSGQGFRGAFPMPRLAGQQPE